MKISNIYDKINTVLEAVEDINADLINKKGLSFVPLVIFHTDMILNINISFLGTTVLDIEDFEDTDLDIKESIKLEINNILDDLKVIKI